MRVFLILISSFMLFGCSASLQKVSQENEERFKSLTKDFVRSCIKIKDDSFEDTIQYDTVNCYQSKNGLLGIVWDDQFVRAYTNRKSGKTKYQIYTRLHEDKWLNPVSANYFVGDNLITSDVARIHSDVTCNASRSCVHLEEIVFEISEENLMQLNEKYLIDNSIEWKYRIKTRSGVDKDKFLNINELLGIYRLVNKI